MIIAIDPGTEDSAYVVLSKPEDIFKVLDKGKIDNNKLLTLVSTNSPYSILGQQRIEHFVIEMVASYGMPVGRSTFETVFWIGRFWEAAVRSGIETRHKIYRKADVCMHLCQTPRAKDANIRQALIDRYGEPGTKDRQGLLYGVTNDIWSALAIGVTYRDRLISPK